jgi:hypothetical protein
VPAVHAEAVWQFAGTGFAFRLSEAASQVVLLLDGASTCFGAEVVVGGI